MTVFLVAVVLQIVVSAPPLPPAEAAAVLARLDSPANRTNVFVCGDDCAGPRVIVVPQKPREAPAGPRVVLRPLNCCDSYSTPLPYPRIDVNIVRVPR